MQMTILSRQQFQHPQVAAMAHAGRLVSIANYLGNPDAFVVGVLDRPGPRKTNPIAPLTKALGLVSFAATLGVVVLSLAACRREAVNREGLPDRSALWRSR